MFKRGMKPRRLLDKFEGNDESFFVTFVFLRRKILGLYCKSRSDFQINPRPFLPGGNADKQAKHERTFLMKIKTAIKVNDLDR
jgi:hypothetical protein